MSLVITWADVAAIAPALTSVTAAAQALILAQVDRQVGANQWGAREAEGQLYLAAHLGTLALNSSASGSSQAVGPVVSQTVGPVSRSFAVLTTGGGGSFDSTSWGTEYARLRKLLPTRFGLVI